MRKLVVFLISLFIIISCVGCSKNEYDKNTAKLPKHSTAIEHSAPLYKQKSIPTLFIHGYAGGKSSFGHMIQRIEKTGAAKQALTLTIDDDGSIHSQGNWKEKNNPMIQVLFSNNKSHEWNQAEWIHQILVYLEKNDQVREVNIVGHSMGGVSTLRYLGNYGKDQNLPKIGKFIAIAAPFNEFIESKQSLKNLLQNGPNEQSPRYLDYISMKENYPQTMQVDLLADQLSRKELTDGRVPLSSSLAVFSLLKNQAITIKQHVYKGKQTQHSQLHENPKIDQEIIDFLWR